MQKRQASYNMMYHRKDQRFKEKNSRGNREKQDNIKPVSVDNFLNSNLDPAELKPRNRNNDMPHPRSCKAGSLKI